MLRALLAMAVLSAVTPNAFEALEVLARGGLHRAHRDAERCAAERCVPEHCDQDADCPESDCPVSHHCSCCAVRMVQVSASVRVPPRAPEGQPVEATHPTLGARRGVVRRVPRPPTA